MRAVLRNNCCPVSVKGKVYPSQKAAAEALGVTRSAISTALMRKGHCDEVGKGKGRVGNTNARAAPVQIGPFAFRSQLQASKLLGIPRTTIRRFCAGECGARGRQAVIREAMKRDARGDLSEFRGRQA